MVSDTDHAHGPRQWILLLLLLLVRPAHAANWLSEVLRYETDQDVYEVEVALGGELELASEFERYSPTGYRARATTPNTSETGWQYAELFFEEEGDNLAKVIFEGSSEKGFEITLEFHEPAVVETIPQYSASRIAIIHTGLKKFQKLHRFSDDHVSTQGPFVVRFNVAGSLDLSAVTPQLAHTKLTYRHPDTREMRVGFFPTETAATVALRELRGKHPDASLVRVTAAEVEYANVFNLYSDRLLAQYDNTGVAPTFSPIDTDAPVVVVQSLTPSTMATFTPEPAVQVTKKWDESLERSALDEAQNAYTRGEYVVAIGLYTKALQDPRLREEALEMLGVARERNGQLAHAKAEYERFLAEFPDAPASNRVDQRLQSLIGSDAGIAQLRKAKSAPDASWYTAGNVSQFYQRYSLDINGQQSTVPINGLFTDLNVITRRQSASATHEARIAAGHIWDFSDDKDSAMRIHRITWGSFFENPGLGFVVGRQSHRNAGILGRYDGVTLTYRQNDSIQWNLVGGYVATSSFDSPSTDRPVIGFNTQLQLLNGDLELIPFFVEYKRDGLTDRRAIGLNSHLFTERATFSNLIDYDIYHQALNNFIVNANYNLNRSWRLSGTYDFRRSPYLTTSNALIGQRYDDLSELEQSLVDLKLNDIAADRTATANHARMGIFGTLNQTWSVSMDGSVAEYSDTNESLGVVGLDNRTDFYLTGQVRANDLFGANTFTAIQGRYMASDNSETSMLFFTNRFSWADWYIFPKVVVSQRTFKNVSQDQLQIRPSVRSDYRGFKRFRIEMELGYEWTNRETVADDLDIQGLYFRLGYRTLF